MHMYLESSHTTSVATTSSAELSSSLANLNKYDTVYYQVYKQIDSIKRFKLNSELNNKEKVHISPIRAQYF